MVSDLPARVGESCIQRLNHYFNKESIWNSALLVIRENGTEKIHPPVFNQRPLVLRYSSADTMITRAPRWQDIFDGVSADRWKVVGRVFADKACRNLEAYGGITTNYTWRCQGRELFKYAAYMDACMTGFNRSTLLHQTIDHVGLTRYEYAREVLDTTPAVEVRESAGWHLVEHYLLTLWLSDKCSPMSFVFEHGSSFNGSSPSRNDHELVEAWQPMYDRIMAIAARAGDRWAVQSYYNKALNRDFDYWMSLRHFDPILFNRWMSEINYSENDKKARALHALEVYANKKRTDSSLEIDKFLRGYGIRRDDFGLSNDRVKLLIESKEPKRTLISPWIIEE